MATKTMEQEILAAYDIAKRKRGEDDQAYFERIIKASLGGNDTQWKELDNVPGAQDWINAGAKALLDKRPVASFEPDAEEDAAPEPETRSRRGAVVEEAKDEPEPEQRPARKAVAKTKADVKATKAADAKAAAKAKADAKADAKAATKAKAKAAKDEPDERAPATKAKKRGNGASGTGVYAKTQQHVVRHPNSSTQDIMTALTKQGLEPQQNTVQSVRGHTRDTIKEMQRFHKQDFGLTV